MPEKRRHLWLLGLSGSGKSTVGPLLARELSLPCLDTDAEIVRTAGKTIPEIFAKDSEEGFRRREEEIVKIFSAGPAAVISCGGGVVTREANRDRMASTGLRIYLQADPALLADRLRSSADRPLLPAGSAEASLAKLHAERAAWYEQSEIRVGVDALRPEEVVREIRKQLPAPWSP